MDMTKIQCDLCWEPREDQGYVLDGEKVCKDCYEEWENSVGHKYSIGQSHKDSWDTLHCSSCNTQLGYGDWDVDMGDVQLVCRNCYVNKHYD